MNGNVPRVMENLAAVRQRIAAAAERVGRQASGIRLVAVTKYVDVALAEELARAGCTDLAESRPQELWRKAASWSGPPVRWHLIGHLQRNKVRRTLPLIGWLHSGDSLPLLAEVDREARALGRMVPTLLEVNISGDAAKHGFDPAEMHAVLPAAAAFEQLDIRGLMTMASRDGDLEQARIEFRRLRQLRDALGKLPLPRGRLDELSMGMSGDLEAAIEEGATMVRVGSALFEGVQA